MKVLKAALIAVLLAVLLIAGLHKPEPSRRELGNGGIAPQVEDVRDAVVHISKVGEHQGSGCIINKDGLVFTAKHVSDGGGEFEVTLDDGTKYGVKHVIEDKENDIAFMQLDLPRGVEVPFVPLSRYDSSRVGDRIFIFGSPHGSENFNTVSLGIISAVDRNLYDRKGRGWEACQEYNWHVMVQSTSPAFPGNSGGPVFNLAGEVIGVLVAGEAPTLNFSVPVGRFRETLEAVNQWMGLARFKLVGEDEEEEESQGEWYLQKEVTDG